jgi:hypothetical protein
MPREFAEIAEAADAIREFMILNRDKLPQHIRDRVEPSTRQGSSPVDLAVNFTKAVYANRGETGVTKEALAIAAGAADLIDMKGFHGRLDDRAAKMALALQRDSGAKGGARGFPGKDKDPPIDQEFAPPAAADADEAAPGEKK